MKQDNKLVVGTSDSFVMIFDLNKKEFEKNILRKSMPIRSVSFDSEGQLVAVALELVFIIDYY